MSDKNVVQKGFIAVMAPLTLALGLGASTSQAAPGYVTDGGSVVVNNYKECWTAKGGVDKKLEECGDVMAKPAPAPAPMPVDGDADGDGVKDSMDRCPNTRPGATIDADGCEVVTNLSLHLVNDNFAFDSAKLTPDMEYALAKMADQLMSTPGEETVTITGHTDSTGPDAYNMKLSMRRAQAAADYLAGIGIARSSMIIEGKGESMPVADNATKAGRAKNRRVEITTR